MGTQEKKLNKIFIATGIYLPDIGGPATHLAQLVPFLKAEKIDVEVVTLSDGISCTRDIEGVRVYSVTRKHSLVRRLFEICIHVWRASFNVDFIYLHDMSIVGSVVLVVHLLTGRPYIVRIGGDFVWEEAFQKRKTDLDYLSFQGNEPLGYRFRRWLGTEILSHARSVIVPSNFLKKIVCGWGINASSIEVVENAIDVDTLGHLSVESEIIEYIYKLKERGIRVIVSSGRFVRRKHFDMLIRAMNDLGDDTHLILIGSGPEASRYAEDIAQLHLDTRVTVYDTQSRSTLFAVFKASDLFVLLDEGETFSFITLEALMAGIPVLLTRAGALPEIFGEYEGKGVTFLSERNEAAVVRSIKGSDVFCAPDLSVQTKLGERYSIERHVTSVCAIMRQISRR